MCPMGEGGLCRLPLTCSSKPILVSLVHYNSAAIPGVPALCSHLSGLSVPWKCVHLLHQTRGSSGPHLSCPLTNPSVPTQERGFRKGVIKDTHLVNEGSKLAVEALDLLLLLVLYVLCIGVDLQVEGREEALVD